MPSNNVVSIPRTTPRELNQAGTSTSETLFTSDGTAAVILPLPSAGQLVATASTTAGTQTPPAGGMGQRPSVAFSIIAAGRAQTGTAASVTIKVYFGTSNTVGSNTAMASTGAVSLATVKAGWRIDMHLVWDTDSKQIDGVYTAIINGTAVATTAVTNKATSVINGNPTTSQSLAAPVPLNGFVVTGTFSSGNATNSANLDWFVLILD